MEKKETNFFLALIQKNPPLSSFLGPLAAGIILLVVGAAIRGVTFKMVYETLINLNVFTVFGVVLLIVAMIFGVLFVKQQWKDSIEKKDEEIDNIKSELGERGKQYDGLVEQLKLPRPIVELITVEKSTKQDGKPDIISPSEGSKPPRFYFPLRVINRIQCSFTPEEIIVWCSCDSDTLMYEGKWNKDIKLPSTDAGAVDISDLEKSMDGNLTLYVPTDKFRIPISEIEDLSKWKLNGTVKYKAKNPVIPDIEDKEIVELGIKLEYELDKETILKIRKL